MSIFTSLDTYCPYPWTNVYVSTEGEVAPCCVWEGKLLGKLQDNSPENLLNGSEFCKVRRKMMNGQQAAGCSKCYRGEAVGASSTRESAQRWLPETLEFAEKYTEVPFGSLLKIKPTAWDIRFNNICNFKCRMCGPQSSTAWYEDWKKLGRGSDIDYHRSHVSSRETGKYLVDLMISHFDSLKEIYFAGGEPLIMEEHYQVLEELIKQQKKGVRIRYNTNLSVLEFKDWNVLEMWEELSNLGNRIEVGVSMDATGKALEYIRKGCSWEKLQENLGKLAYADINFFLAPTICILNVYRFLDMFKWYYENISPFRWMLPGVSILGYPEHYNLRILPDKEKDKIRKTYREFISGLTDQEQIIGSQTTLEAIVNYLDGTVENSDRHVETFFRETKTLDNIRQENFLDINPEFADWWNEHN